MPVSFSAMRRASLNQRQFDNVPGLIIIRDFTLMSTMKGSKMNSGGMITIYTFVTGSRGVYRAHLTKTPSGDIESHIDRDEMEPDNFLTDMRQHEASNRLIDQRSLDDGIKYWVMLGLNDEWSTAYTHFIQALVAQSQEFADDEIPF